MKTCIGCKYAQWKKTKANRLHPSGDGTCEFPYKIPKLPAAMYWIGNVPNPSGSYINRNREFDDNCVYWSAED